MTKKCSECVYAVVVNEGYSNWTVTGSVVWCGKFLHPNPGFDEWYGENKDDKFAETCESFLAGERVNIDVDASWESEKHQYEAYSNGYVTNEDIMRIVK